MPEWVKKLGEGEENIAADAINEAIPSLALTEEDETLPVVNLPGTEDTMAEDVVNVKAEPKVASRNFHELLNNAPVANDNHEQDAAPVVSVDANGVVSAPHAPTTHNTSSLTPITVSAHSHLTPHMAAAEQVHVAITSMKEDGLNSITMQLEPTDLGRVEIKMDTIDGKTNISFLVDKPETLDALSRDARSLERQLQEAGVRADAGSMQFNLRQQPQQEMADDAKGGKGSGPVGLDEPVSIEGALPKHYTLNVREGVDIHA
jgi:flagellar hook-length control protein FliK